VADSSASDGRIVAVAVSYDINGNKQNVRLDRANFVAGADHPALYVTEGGVLDFSAMATKSTGHDLADNMVSTRFVLDGDAGEGYGIVGWTASLGDSFWRSFAYRVSDNEDGSQTAQSTFGFAPSLKSGTGSSKTVTLPSAGLGMFCNWAQGNGATTSSSSSTYLQAGNLSGPAQNLVQYQVSIRTKGEDIFEHQASMSHMKYRIAADCGTGSQLDLSSIKSDGSIDGEFTVPEVEAIDTLGGVEIGEIDLDIE
jgi:hypothetical protein